jgi:hypothetical protein
MINIPFEMHIALHVRMGTLIMVYVSFETCMGLAMTYIPIKICLAFHVNFKTLAMSYILVKIRLVFHVYFGTLAMVYILIRVHMAVHVPFGTLVMTYIPIETCMASTMVNILVKMHLAHNIILDVSSNTKTKIHYVFQIMKIMFHYNLI